MGRGAHVLSSPTPLNRFDVELETLDLRLLFLCFGLRLGLFITEEVGFV
jgi:hypothetical protein